MSRTDRLPTAIPQVQPQYDQIGQERTLLDRPGVARKLCITVEKFYRQRAALEADGFPPPVFGHMSGARWDPRAINLWLDRKLPMPAPVASTSSTSRTVIDWETELDRNAAAIGGGRR